MKKTSHLNKNIPDQPTVPSTPKVKKMTKKEMRETIGWDYEMKPTDAMEKIMMYSFDPFDYWSLNCQLGHESTCIGDIVDDNLSDEMMMVYNALEELEDLKTNINRFTTLLNQVDLSDDDLKECELLFEKLSRVGGE